MWNPKSKKVIKHDQNDQPDVKKSNFSTKSVMAEAENSLGGIKCK
jgi:hypothetical protein